MKITRISDDSHQLTKLGLLNCYLVRESGAAGEADSFTLIDTTMGAAKAILEAAQSLGAPIRRVLLTHAHGDHVGSLDDLAKRLGGAPFSTAQLAALQVAIGARETRLLSQPPDKALEPLEPPCKIKGSLPGTRTPATHALLDGELYGSLRCIATPGHTPGHFSYLDERDGTLYTGDALVTIGGSPHICGFGPWYFPFPKLATWHRPTAVASLRKLADTTYATPIQRLAPGHGRVLEGGTDLLNSALNNAK